MKTIQQLYDQKNLSLEDLIFVRQELKNKIENKQNQLLDSSRRLMTFPKIVNQNSLKDNLFSIVSLLTSNKYGKIGTVVEGIIVGYKISKSIRKLFRK